MVRHPPSPRIALRAHIIMVSLVVLVAALVIAFGVHRSILMKSLEVGALTAVVMTVYYSLMLYCGTRYAHGRLNWSFRTISYEEVRPSWSDTADGVSQVGDLVGGLAGGASEGGCIGLLVVVAVVVGAIALLPVLAWLGLNALLITSFVIVVPLYALLRYGFRLVLSQGRRCHQDFGKSVLIGLLHGTMAGVIIGLVFLAADWLI